MAITLDQEGGGRILLLYLTGHVTEDDYRRVLPVMERCIAQHGKVRLLCVFENIESVDAGAMACEHWFQCQHMNDVERMAIVDDEDWDHSMPDSVHPSFSGEVRSFPIEHGLDALKWIEEGVGPTRIACLVGWHDNDSSPAN